MLIDSTFRAAFWDGLSGPALLFGKVKRPGSCSAELDEMLTPDLIAGWGETHPNALRSLLELREKSHKRDAAYATLARICGSISLLGTIVALGFIVFYW